MPLLEWFANNYKRFGATLEIVTDKSQEGSQFVKGFGGIGGKCSLQITFCREIKRYCHISILLFFFFRNLAVPGGLPRHGVPGTMKFRPGHCFIAPMNLA